MKNDKIERMKKVTGLLVCYMLAVALCASGIILNFDSAGASGGSIFGGGKNETLDIILWVLIGLLTVAVIIASALIALKSRKKKA